MNVDLRYHDKIVGCNLGQIFVYLSNMLTDNERSRLEKRNKSYVINISYETANARYNYFYSMTEEHLFDLRYEFVEIVAKKIFEKWRFSLKQDHGIEL